MSAKLVCFIRVTFYQQNNLNTNLTGKLRTRSEKKRNINKRN